MKIIKKWKKMKKIMNIKKDEWNEEAKEYEEI